MLRCHAGAAVVLAGAMAASLQAQADWPGYGRDKGAQRYSPLAQINTGNVAKLIPAWTFSMKRDGLPFRPSQSIPLVVNGIMYLGWPFNHVAGLPCGSLVKQESGAFVVAEPMSCDEVTTLSG